jgi:uncharacterized protein (UPF0335 family)
VNCGTELTQSTGAFRSWRISKADNTSASGGIKMHQGYNMVPLNDQVKQLEDAKKQLQAQIEDIENEARKNGIEPGELR